MELKFISARISKIPVWLFQPVLQLILYVLLYEITWIIIYQFELYQPTIQWGLNSIFYLNIFFVSTFLLGVMLFFLNNKSFIVTAVSILIFYLITFLDFIELPIKVSIVWGIVLISTLLSYAFVNYQSPSKSVT
ncbi:MAG TPA: hypothetical protein DEO59_04315 [Balneola sp.]|jgi:hypothetical protein|nr:hypothetical protein [Balneola sp.]MAO78076.1 hypothetical protein [Balneola sp.]MBF64077.1 hypothetical protein [Balneola sp.]HBZ37721.1 hypothetical protein [Balneola sp.]